MNNDHINGIIGMIGNMLGGIVLKNKWVIEIKKILKGGNLTMKRMLTPLLVLLMVILFVVYDLKENLMSSGQQKAVANSIEFIRNSSFTSKRRIDTNIIIIENATESTWKAVYSKETKIEENSVDSTDWIIIIGDILSPSHDYTFIVCDSETYKVIGFIPIE